MQTRRSKKLANQTVIGLVANTFAALIGKSQLEDEIFPENWETQHNVSSGCVSANFGENSLTEPTVRYKQGKVLEVVPLPPVLKSLPFLQRPDGQFYAPWNLEASQTPPAGSSGHPIYGIPPSSNFPPSQNQHAHRFEADQAAQLPSAALGSDTRSILPTRTHWFQQVEPIGPYTDKQVAPFAQPHYGPGALSAYQTLPGQPQVQNPYGQQTMGQLQQPMPYGQQPQLMPYGQQPQPMPYGQQPQPVPYGQQPQPVPYGQQLQPVPYGQQPQPVPYGQQPQPVPYGQHPQPY
eukprot:GHVP01047692.1.p1 GENE.GHVP01047692.1~~GHVP01047692.1.p1  ORF type:complete len:292 (-),score=32.74 GHVP01047692.1:169-1044(-)